MDLHRRVRAAWKAFTGPLVIEGNQLNFEGIIRLRELPFETEEEYKRWWLPETGIRDGKVVILRPARMSEKEKERYTVAQHHNLLTSSGRTQILGYIGTPTYISSQVAFAQIFSVGTATITSVSAGDGTVFGELARAVPSTAIVTGTQIDISIFFGATQAVGTWTNVGLYGGGSATTTLGTGTLLTHSLFSYVKDGSHTASADYLINLT